VFTDVNLADSTFENVNLSKVRMHDINLSDLDLSAAQIGGASFRHIGPPPNQDGKQERQRPVTFEEMMLCDSTFRNVDLSNVKIIDCDMRGMTINGVLVTDLIAAYHNQRK
jgi:RNA polymerase sigma-70 factor (ECF subfamily)